MIRLALAGLLCLALAAPAMAAKEKIVTKRSSTGDYALATVSATVKNPKKIRVKVVASPNQKASLTWLLVCSKGLSSSSKDGQGNVTTPATKTLSHPMLSKASSCIVSATAQLDTGGKLTISILATKR